MPEPWRIISVFFLALHRYRAGLKPGKKEKSTEDKIEFGLLYTLISAYP
jgi:hypothetical protein